ncbi:hypothetical protein FF1_003023 [Malus domestica]
MHHMDHSLMIFFTLKDLKLGKTMAIYFPKRNLSKSPHLLPRVEADLFPFSSKQLHYLLQVFSFSQDSPQAKAMEDTLRHCETAPIKEEIKSCATSLESMLDFARSIFGLDNTFRNYTILEEPKEVLAPKMMACHTMPYPYAVFYCHSQERLNKVYKVSLGGEDGDRVDAVAVCHLDTSQWSPNHASFQVLRIKPGPSPVCHFFPADNLVWVPTSTSV